MNERRQFLALYRTFLFRAVDLELLSASGDIRNLLGQFAALLAAFSFILAAVVVPHFALSTISRSRLEVETWSVEEFLISTTITVVALFGVLSWNSMTPARRDAFILGPLPVRGRIIFAAQASAALTALAISVVAVNLFTGFSMPLVMNPDSWGIVRRLIAHWATLAAAGAFAFGCIFAIQNVATALLSNQLFQRASSILQLLVLFAALTLFFLTPALATPVKLSAPANEHILALLPSYWFLGFFESWNGSDFRPFQQLSSRADWAVTSVFCIGFLASALTHRRGLRRAIEQPDIVPGASISFLPRIALQAIAATFRDPIDRAIVSFSARTLVRSRQHRLVLAVYIGVALAISLAYTKALLFGGGLSWREPSASLLIPGIVLLFFALLGTRAVFALPIELQANWIFRITNVRRPATYFAAIRRSLFVVGAVPVLVSSAALYLWIWPLAPACGHVLVLFIFSFWLVQSFTRKWRKIPFSCSYLPARTDLRLKFGIAAFLFLFAIDVGANLEQWCLANQRRFWILIGFLAVGAMWSARRTRAVARAPENRVQFEEKAGADIFALDLRPDADYVNASDYIEGVIASPPW